MPQAVAVAASWVATAVASTVSVALGAAGLGGIAATWGVVGVYYATEIALYAGLGYAIDAVQRPKQKPIGAELTFSIDPDYPREMVVGERMLGGSMVARYSKGPDRSQAHMVIQVADHPCEALLEAYGDSRLVRNTALTHGVRTEITAYSNSGGPRVWMTWHDGRPGQTADADLVSASAQDPEVVAGRMPAWTSNHKGAGCAYVHVEVRYDSDILTSIPSFLFKVRGAKFYDRRLDSTAGGSGSHRLDTPSTWAYTTNAAVVWDHYSLGYKVEDDDLAFGIGLSKTELPYAQFAQAADLADEDVETGTGGGAETIKRYAINGVLSAATFFLDQLEDFQIQMAARIVDLGGRIGLIGAEEKVSAVSLSDGDLVAGEPFQFAPKLQFSDLYGQVSGSFADPANNYQGTPYQTQYSAYAQLPDGGEAQAVTMDLPLEVHPRRAARNISAWLARESLQPRLVGVFMPKAWKLEVGDWFDYTDTGLQIEAAMFEVIDIVKNEDFTVTITARAVDPDFLAFDNDNDPDLSVPPDVPPVSLYLDPPEFDAEVSTITAGDVVEPCLEVTLTSDSAIARELIFEYGVSDPAWDEVDQDEAVLGPTFVDSVHIDQIVTKLRKSILPSTAYRVRAKVRAGVRESPWTDWSDELTTGATYSVGSAASALSVPWSGVEDDDGERPEDGADVTGDHVAASIVGQAPAATDSTIAAGATKNIVTYASSAPSSPVNGDVWVDTSSTPNVIKVRVSGAWQTGGTVGGVFGSTLYETGGGSVATLANFKTILGTSAAFTGQGGLSTLNFVTLGTNFRAADGTTVLTGGDLLNTQAAFASRKAWDFDSGLDSWSHRAQTGNALAASGGIVTLTSGGTNSTYLISPNNLGYSGADVPVIRMRVRRTDADPDTNWSGIAYYITSGHGYSASYYKSIASPQAAQNEWFIAEFDMSALTAGGTDYLTNSITRLRFDFSSSVTAVWEIDWVALGRKTYDAFTLRGVTDSADQTSLNVAASVTGQGSLALLSFVTLNSNVRLQNGTTVATDAMLVTASGVASSVSGQGSLATQNFVLFSSNVRLANGTTVVTDVMVVTASGVASAISGQGDLATLNDASTIGYATPSSGNLSTSYVSKVSKAITTDGGVVEIEFAAIFELMNPIVAESGSTDVNVQCKVKRDSTELLADFVLCGWRFRDGIQYNYSKVQGRVILTDTPSAGSRTYSVELKTNVGGSDVGLVAARMVSGGNLMRILNPIGAANSVS